MADLIVAAGTVLKIDAAFPIQPQYDLFRMEANSSIRAEVDLKITARRAEFGANCVIDATGQPGGAGASGAIGAMGQFGVKPGGGLGGNGAPGGAGQNGRSVTIEAGLAAVGTLTIIANGGGGGNGGAGGAGGNGAVGGSGGDGGAGGAGGQGGNGGVIGVRWIPLAAGLGGNAEGPPAGHTYSATGGAKGPGGDGGRGGLVGPMAGGGDGADGLKGADGIAGTDTAPAVTFGSRAPAQLLWVQKQDMGPASRMDHAIAFDPARRVAVLFGGNQAARLFADTWEWDGQLWVQVADTGPTGRSLIGMTYDPVNAKMLLFGGSGPAPNGNTFGDTWLWDGQVWMQVEDSGPSPRAHVAIATDPVRKRVVLFGGEAVAAGGEITLLGDTWEWDGTEWAQRDDVGPSRRAGARMAYDAAGGRVVLFGGSDGALQGDTWGWDGDHWKQLADIGPRPRIGHAMASNGSGAIVFGGRTSLDPIVGAADPALVGDTWAFHDERWRQIQDIGPSPRTSHAMTFDDIEQRVILFGGQPGPGAFAQDTWHLAERPRPPR